MTESPPPNHRSEWLAWLALGLILVVFPAAVLGYQYVARPALAEVRTIDIIAAAPEAGGFQPESIRVAAGETVRLRFSVPDVTHGIAIGPGLGIDLGHIDPGQVKEVEVTFDEAGRYTLYCNTWCSPNHWRMRSTIEVYDPADPDRLPAGNATDPVIDSLAERGVDIDAPHEAAEIPAEQPSAARGAEVVTNLGEELPVELADLDWRRSHSPVEGWLLLVDSGVSEADAWDGVAHLWLSELEPARRGTAAELYAKNCAACHGETGDGRGPGADALAAQGMGHTGEMHNAGGPAAFADPTTMLGGSGDIYYAKIRRGGMGTGMPGFGPLFTPEETWLLVDYLWTFVFEPDGPGATSGD
jgi:plastocyanin/mono/diheme cytochrome c family protein